MCGDWAVVGGLRAAGTWLLALDVRAKLCYLALQSADGGVLRGWLVVGLPRLWFGLGWAARSLAFAFAFAFACALGRGVYHRCCGFVHARALEPCMVGPSEVGAFGVTAVTNFVKA